MKSLTATKIASSHAHYSSQPKKELESRKRDGIKEHAEFDSHVRSEMTKQNQVSRYRYYKTMTFVVGASLLLLTTFMISLTGFSL